MSVEFSSDVCQSGRNGCHWLNQKMCWQRGYTVFSCWTQSFGAAFQPLRIFKKFSHFSGLTLAMWQARHRNPADRANRRRIRAAVGGSAEWTYRRRSILDQCSSAKQNGWLVRTKLHLQGTAHRLQHVTTWTWLDLHPYQSRHISDCEVSITLYGMIWDGYANTNILWTGNVQLGVSNLVVPQSPSNGLFHEGQRNVFGATSYFGSTHKPQKSYAHIIYMYIINVIWYDIT